MTLFIDQNEDPLLSVLPIECDPFYIDQGILHVNIFVRGTTELEVLTLTPNREVVESQTVPLINNELSELEAILQRLLEKKYVACKGFDWQNETYNIVLQRLRKTELDSTLIGTCNYILISALIQDSCNDTTIFLLVFRKV